MKKNNLIVLTVLLLAAFLRFFQLGQNPPSLDWDEASLGYNAYSILKTGRDEFGRFLPVSIRSFEDYKPAVYTYLTIPAVAIFGLTEFAVRLPSSVFGTLTVLGVYFLVKELFAYLDNKIIKVKPETIALLVMFFLAISPWHLQFSRVAFEANVALFFVSVGILGFLKGLRVGWWWIVSVLAFVLSFYTYHSPRLIVPLLLTGWLIYFRQNIWEKRKWVVVSIVFAIILLLPFIKEVTGEGRARFGSVTVLNPNERLAESIKHIDYDQSQGDTIGKLLHNRRIIYAQAIIKGYLDHFNLDFLFLNGDAPDRHHARDMGMLYIWEAPFILLGILILFKAKRLRFPLFWWFIVAPSASALTTGTPHAVRAIFYLPLYQILTVIGIMYLFSLKNKIGSVLFKIGAIFTLTVILISTFWYFESYYIISPIESAKDWQYGYKQAIEAARKYEDQVDKIVITYHYDQPHVYVLFYNRIDPAWYQSQQQPGKIKRFDRVFGKYEFRNIEWDRDQYMTNTLFIGTEQEIPVDVFKAIADIHFPDSSVAFRIVKR